MKIDPSLNSGGQPPSWPPPQPPQGSNATLPSAFSATPQPRQQPQPQPHEKKPSPYQPQNPSMFTPQVGNATIHGAFPSTPQPQPQHEKPKPYPQQNPPLFTPQVNYNNIPPYHKQAYPPPTQPYPPFGQTTKGSTSFTASYSGHDQAIKFPPQSSPRAEASYYPPATTNPIYGAMPPPASPLKQTAHHATGIPVAGVSPPHHHHHQPSDPYLQPHLATSPSWKNNNGQPNCDPGKVCGAIFRLVTTILGLSSLISCACQTNVSRGIDGTGPPVMESHCVWNFCGLCGDDNKEPKHNPHYARYGSMGESNMPLHEQQPQPAAEVMPPLNQNMRA